MNRAPGALSATPRANERAARGRPFLPSVFRARLAGRLLVGKLAHADGLEPEHVHDRGQSERNRDQIHRDANPPDRLEDRELGEAIRKMALDVGPDAFLRQLNALIARPDQRPGLSDYKVPSLLICGHEDAITPLEFHEEMADLIPNAKLATIEQCGHMAAMERPQATTALLRQWLSYD